MPALLDSGLSTLTLAARGKVRDIYDLGDKLLLVATDRISAFDHVLGSGIPGKGIVLTQMSLFWFDFLRSITANHLISAEVADFPTSVQGSAAELEGRSMLVHKARMFPVECVVRGYISGSAWKDYLATGDVCGIRLPQGLKESDKLPEPIFTPATKSEVGSHDINIGFGAMVDAVGLDTAKELRDRSLAIYAAATTHAESKGLILADTKFEFGETDQGMILADEVLTPDSSRFWPAELYKPGGAQPSFDKQFVRDYLEEIGWNKQAPAPSLPEEVIRRTGEKYREAYTLLTGKALSVPGGAA